MRRAVFPVMQTDQKDTPPIFSYQYEYSLFFPHGQGDFTHPFIGNTDKTKEVLQKADEEAANPLFAPYYPPHLDPGSLNDRLFKMQAELIKEKAATENCVIVGRCGNYVLEEAENAVHVFIYADEDAKIKRTMERHQLNREEATKRMKKIDKQRRAYYQYYTEWRWARTEGFDLMLNSSALGVDATVAAIKAVVEAKMK